MGAGKSTIGRKVARLTKRSFIDLDKEIEKRHGPIAQIFEESGEPEFRRIEERFLAELLAGDEPAVVSLGGGTVVSAGVWNLLEKRAFTVWIEVDVDEALRRVRGSGRPLARDEAEFRRLYEERETLYFAVSDGFARDTEDVLLACLGINVERGALGELLTRNELPLIADERVLDLHARNARETHRSVQAIPSGEEAKTFAVVQRIWDELDADRGTDVVALGGGSTLDVAGFAAATYLRGLSWIAAPTTLVAQVDAAIGGKTAINILKGKNLVGAFHYPEWVAIDPDVLATLPERERRNGMAEVVKTGLLAGKQVWDLAEEEMIRACAAFKCAVCISDPYEQTGRRAILNLGHTFAHAVEAASDYTVNHGEAVALGLLAALRLSGLETDVVEEILQPEPVRVDRERAWAALQRDKKARDGRIRLVLLDAPGKPVFPAELPEKDVRGALDALIAD